MIYINPHDVTSFHDSSGVLLNYSDDKSNYQVYFTSVEEALKALNFKYVRDITGDAIIEYSIKEKVQSPDGK
jgi:hypothetical protein